MTVQNFIKIVRPVFEKFRIFIERSGKKYGKNFPLTAKNVRKSVMKRLTERVIVQVQRSRVRHSREGAVHVEENEPDLAQFSTGFPTQPGQRLSAKFDTVRYLSQGICVFPSI